MPNQLTKDEFLAQLAAQIGQNSDRLYQQYLSVQIDPFAESSAPLKTGEFQPKHSGVTKADMQAKVDELEASMGYERLGFSLGKAFVKIGIAYASGGIV